jgi:hypothetical protein
MASIGSLFMFLRILGDAMSVIEIPNTATKRLNKPTITSLDKVGAGRLVGWRGCMGAALAAKKNVSKAKKVRKPMLGVFEFDWLTLTGVDEGR